MSKTDKSPTDGCLHCKVMEVIRAHCRHGNYIRLDVHEVMDDLGAVIADVFRHVPPEYHVDGMATLHGAIAGRTEYLRERDAEAARGPVTTGGVN